MLTKEVILKELKPYLFRISDFDLSMIDYHLRQLGCDGFLNKYLYTYLNCTKYTGNWRPIQTIGYIYKRDMSKTIYFIDNFVDENDALNWLNKLYDVHLKNLEFEKQYPPIDYDKDKPKKKTRRKVEKDNEEDNVTLAEMKLKLKASKLSKLKFKMT